MIERLRLAALEQRRAVHARQQIDFAVNRPQRLVVAAVGPRAAQDQIAHDALFQVVPRLRKRIERRSALGRRARE